jgi:hypothetical protein
MTSKIVRVQEGCEVCGAEYWVEMTHEQFMLYDLKQRFFCSNCLKHESNWVSDKKEVAS